MAARKRGHGEGGIYQRESDGRWCASVDLGIVNGKRKRKVVYGETRRAVAEQLKQLQRAQADGVNIAPPTQTVKQFLERWLKDTIKPTRRIKTYTSYEQMVRVHLIPHVGHHQLTKLAPEHVQAMLNTLLVSGGKEKTGLSPRTVQYVRAILRQALGEALRWGHVPRNVAALVAGPRVEKYQITPLTPEQARQLLSAVAGHRLEALYHVVLSLGLREGEVLALRWEDVNLSKRTLRVAGAIQEINGKLHRVLPKTASSVRTLPLSERLVEMLLTQQRVQEQYRAELGDEWQEHDLVFPSELGTPTSPRNLVRHFKLALVAADLSSTVRFHDLRHSCATFLISQGVHPRVVMEILGHSQISVTMNTYAHVLPETQRAAAATLDALLAPPPADRLAD